jgi:hypothetical protein
MDSANNKDELEAFERARSKRRSTELIFRFYGLLGLSAAIFGIGYMLLERTNFFSGADDRIRLLFIISGALIAILSQFALIYYRSRQERTIYELLERDKVFKFIERWRELEELTSPDDKNDLRATSPRSMVASLLDDNLISRADADAIEGALTVRNAIIHSNAAIPIELIDRYLSDLTNIIDSIKTKRREMRMMGQRTAT